MASWCRKQEPIHMNMFYEQARAYTAGCKAMSLITAEVFSSGPVMS